ncbi:DUF433 domain-containing protein [Candidatus Aerophobetes bacterium]|nr:DUF433 domain-containing protein [Candidatus Aerophobetes bacterium]
MAKAIKQVHIVKNEGICGGQPCIAGTRIKVQHIVLEYERLGWIPDQICDAHPGLTLAGIHAAITYYYDHKNEIDSAIQKDEEFVSRLRRSLC